MSNIHELVCGLRDKNDKYAYQCLKQLESERLMDAYSYALGQQAKLLTKKHLEATRISGYLRDIVLDGIEDGESRMSRFLSDGDSNGSSAARDQNKDEGGVPVKRTTAKNKKPFKRNPKRDMANDGLINVSPKGGKLAYEICLTIDRSDPKTYLPMFDMLNTWYKEGERLECGDITKDKYDTWRYNYPRVNANRLKAQRDGNKRV